MMYDNWPEPSEYDEDRAMEAVDENTGICMNCFSKISSMYRICPICGKPADSREPETGKIISLSA